MHSKVEADGARTLRRRALELALSSGGELREHARRVARLGLAVADGMHLGEDLRLEVELGALLHDIGKSALPMRVLAKPDRLDDDEWALMRIHTVEGERLTLAAGMGARLGRIVRATHERWDGEGYPDGLRERAIPLAARIIFCADAFDAMTTSRPYRAALTCEAAVAELRRGAGSQFDPLVAHRLAATVERIDGRFQRTARDRNPVSASLR